ncbi:aminoacyl-tRNA hydrolase [Chloroflexota bacterium]
MKLIVGLGNPGRVYAHSRHNIGFMCLNHFAKAHDIRFDKKQSKARTGTGEVAGKKVIVARPQTGMNLIGEAVSRLVKKFKLSPSDLIVIHDDLDLPLGKIRISYDSGSGGHKGVNSIVAHLNRQDFIRIRVGVGRPDIQADSVKDKEVNIIDYVLSDFTTPEKKIITKFIPEVGESILCLLTEGLTAAMNKFN